MSSFEDISIENIQHCPEDIFSGIKTRVYYAPASFFAVFRLPDSQAYEDSVVIAESYLQLHDGLAWSYLDVLVDENDFGFASQGPARRKKLTTSLNLYILGLKSQIIGFIQQHQNTPMVFMILDANGNYWLIGTTRNPAILEKADGNSGKKYEDNAGVSVTLSAKSPLYRFGGSIGPVDETEINTSRRGGFYDITHL